jgi:quercetin dioxygenase-like cupin family protein
VHGFRNATDAELTYLNMHAPGQGFVTYMRALRDGRRLSYDQEPPPATGTRPSTEAVIGCAELLADDPALRVALLADTSEIAIAEVAIDPDAPSPPRHLHRAHVESFHVLEGELTLVAGERELRAEAGSWVQVPVGVPHTVAFTGSSRVRFLNVHTPGSGLGAFLRALHGAVGEEERAAARAAFDQEPAP